MNAFVVAFIFALGASAWIYTKLSRRAGYGNGQTALTASGVAFVLIFLVVFTLGHMLLSSSN